MGMDFPARSPSTQVTSTTTLVVTRTCAGSAAFGCGLGPQAIRGWRGVPGAVAVPAKAERAACGCCRWAVGVVAPARLGRTVAWGEGVEEWLCGADAGREPARMGAPATQGHGDDSNKESAPPSALLERSYLKARSFIM